MFRKSVLLASVLAISQTVRAVDPIVALNYTTYAGTALPNGISQWLGMRFAAPPLGNLRFAAPQDPVVNMTVTMANKVCHQLTDPLQPVRMLLTWEPARPDLSGDGREPVQHDHFRGLPVSRRVRAFKRDPGLEAAGFLLHPGRRLQY